MTATVTTAGRGSRTGAGWGDFRRLWLGESVSLIGSQVSTLAVPLLAVTALAASPLQVGLLNAAGFLPFLLLTLPAGVLVDRRRRRPLLVWSNLVRAAVLGLLAVLAHTGVVSLGHLCAVALVTGAGAVVFDLALHSHVPDLVPRRHLGTANSWLYGSVSVAQVGGPALAGLLLETIGAPAALLLDAASFVAAAALLLSIRSPETAPAGGGPGGGLLAPVREGLRFMLRHPLLRPCVAYATAYNCCWMALQTAFLVHAVRVLHFGAGHLGAVLGVAALGSVAGSVLAGRLSRRLGTGRGLAVSMALACTGPALVPLAGGPAPLLTTVLVAGFLVGDLGSAMANVQVATLRQQVTPSGLLGRLNAGYRLLAWGALPVGALAGGALTVAAGSRVTLALTAAGFLVTLAAVLRSALPGARGDAGPVAGP